MMTDQFHCMACTGQHATQVIPAAHPEHRYRVCAQCGMGQLWPMPPAPEQLYTRDYFVDGGQRAGYVDYEADERWHRITARQRLGRLEKVLGQVPEATGRSLVDVGAATGFFLDVARERGWQVNGVEASQWAADRARGRGHRVESQLADYTDPVTAVSLFQVLEHVPDPQALLQQAAALLESDGAVICETWDVGSRTARLAGRRWQQLSPPSVLWLFSRDAMARMAERAGLELVTWQPSPKLVSLSTVLGQSVAAANRGTVARALSRAGQLVALPYPLDDLVTTVLRKP